LEVLVERVRACRMVGQQGVGLDVEREVLRCALDPHDRIALRRSEVVGRVDLYQAESRRVELQAFLRGPRVGGVEVPVLDQRLVGPRRGADQDRARCHRQPQEDGGTPASFLRSTAAFACSALRFAAFRSRCAHTYSVARIVRPMKIRSHPGPGSTRRVIPASSTPKPAMVTAMRLPLRWMKRATALSGANAGCSCQRRATSGSMTSSSATVSEASTSSGSSPQMSRLWNGSSI